MSQDDLEPLPPDLHDLLWQGRPGGDPPSGAREATLSFVARNAATLGAAAAVHGALQGAFQGASKAAASVARHGALGQGAAGTLAALKGSIGIGGLIVGAAVGTVVGAAGHAAIVARHGVSAPVIAVRAETNPAPAVPASVPPVASASVPPEVVLPSRSVTSAVRVEQARPNLAANEPRGGGASGAINDEISGDKDTSLGSERALIDTARTAVARGQGDAALSPLERHGREFPRGRLAEEREWLWIQALLLTGRTDAAKEHASRFRNAFPHSLVLPALDRLVASESLRREESGETGAP